VYYPNYSSEIRLIFNSDRQTTRPGFELRVNQIANSCNNPVSTQSTLNPPIVNPSLIPDYGSQQQTTTKICGQSSAIVSIFQSDNYPFAYNSNTDCYYKVIRSNLQVCRLEIYFDDFEVGFDDNTNININRRICSDDYLEIEGTRYCGRRKGERIIVNFPNNKQQINIKFHTNSVDHFAGFRIQVRQIDDTYDRISFRN
jgi:hypothetical protein